MAIRRHLLLWTEESDTMTVDLDALTRSPQTGLRPFLAKLRSLPSQGIAIVDREVDAVQEMGAVLKRMEGIDNRATLFTNVRGHEMPVLLNLYGCKSRIAVALGLPESASPNETIATFDSRLGGRGSSRIVDEVPVQEVVARGKVVDLGTLPIGIHAAKQGGRYINAGVMLARDPATGAINGGIYRLMVQGPDKLTVSVDPGHDLGRIIAHGKATQKPVEFAIVIGADPIVFLASQAKVHISRDVYDVAGALKGDNKPVDVAKCLTNSLLIPSDAEIIIEGHIVPGETAAEGPYGEFSYYYGSDEHATLCRIDAITRRRDAVYADIHPVHADHRCLWLHPGREVSLLQRVRALVPNAMSVHLPLEGAGMIAVVSIRKRHNGDARRALLFMLASDMFIKHAIVVDDDIDVQDPSRVVWALTTRFQGNRDLVVVPDVWGYSEDPSGYYLTKEGEGGRLTTKVGYDATKSLGTDFPEPADILKEEFRQLDPFDYISNPLPREPKA